VVEYAYEEPTDRAASAVTADTGAGRIVGSVAAEAQKPCNKFREPGKFRILRFRRCHLEGLVAEAQAFDAP